MEYFLAPLGQDFNKTYADVVNSSIIPPPHYTGRVPHSFFFTKRGGFTEYAETETFDTIYDIVETGSDIYYIGKIGTNVLVKKNSSTLYTGTYVAGVNYKFYYINTAKGTRAESGTGASGITVGADVAIQDTTKTWTPNAYAGKYVYIYDATAGTGQVMKIDRNDATTLTVTQTGWKTPPTAASYYIFNDYGDTLSFVGPDYLYTIHNDTSIVKIKSVPNPLDAIYFKGRNYIIDSSKHVFVGEQGFFAGYFNIDSLVGALDDVVNIIDFQDFVLLIGLNQIKVLQSENIVLTTTSGTTTASNVKTVFKIVGVTSSFGAFSQNSFVVYNQGLYIFTKYRQLLSLSITAVGIDKYYVDTKPQGIYIQKFLDTLASSDHIKIFINDQNIIFIVNNNSLTNIFIYDFIYMGWHRRETDLVLGGYKNNKFLGPKIYEISNTSILDDGVNEYDQNIKMVIGEENIFNMKRSLLSKFYITKNTSLNSTVAFTIEVGGNVDFFEKELISLGYLQFAAGAYSGTSNTMGSNILGYGLLGNQKLSLSSIVAEIACIEIPTGFFYELLIIEFKGQGVNKVEFGGMMTGYALYEPQVTAYKNVI